MKRLFTTILTVLASRAIFALPVGNPSEATLFHDGLIWEGSCCNDFDRYSSWCDQGWCDMFSFRLGFYGDYVFQRHSELQSYVDNSIYMDLDGSTIYTNAAYLVLNMWDCLDFFATLGASDLLVSGNASAFNDTSGSIEYALL